MSVTLVTAFYPIKSKFPTSQYLEWIRFFMTLECPTIVVFTSSEMVPEIVALRSGSPLHIKVLEFEELDTWKLWKTSWREHHSIDPEAFRHSPELYAVWAQKAFFVSRAANENPFNTEYFMWTDIGAFRTPIPDLIRKTYPTSQHFRDDKVLIVAIEELRHGDDVPDSAGIPGHLNSLACRLVGGLFGGSKTACNRWLHAYSAMIDRYIATGKFVGKDQTVMLSTYLDNRSLLTVVKPTLQDVNGWFFLPYLCSELNVAFAIDETYL